MKLDGTHSKLTITTGCLDKIASKFTSKIKVNKPTKRVKLTRKNKQVEVIGISPPILPSVRNRPATEPVILKVCNVKLSFDI